MIQLLGDFGSFIYKLSIAVLESLCSDLRCFVILKDRVFIYNIDMK